MEKKKILIIATGGTIAGNSPDGKAAVYTAGQQDIDEILQSVPLIHTLADLKMETVCRKDSNDIGMEDLFAIKAICEKAQLDPEIDGIVITHGTDTLEESAYALNLVLDVSKPVILTGAMRPATATSPDGPMNLYQAVGLACDENASGMGVLAVFSDGIYAARDIIKTNSIKTDAFSKSESGLIGYMQDEKAYWYFSPYRKHTNRSLFTDIDHKPEKRVEIFYAHQDADGKLLQFLLDHCDGVVIAGTGAGNYSREIQDVIAAYDGDCKIVRSSRLLEGAAFASPVFDPDQKTIPAQKLPCHKARILLLLCLEKNLSYAQCVQAFEEY